MKVTEVCGRDDPSNCLLIATARVKGVPIVTRDGAMRELAAGRPAYLAVIAC